MPTIQDASSSPTVPQKPRNKQFPRPATITPAKVIDAAEDHKLLKAQRLFHKNLIDNFQRYLAEKDAQVRAAEAERQVLIAKHEQAPGKIVECDRMIAALEKTYQIAPQ